MDLKNFNKWQSFLFRCFTGSMQIINQYQNNQYSPKFKQILPKHLYINSAGYAKDEKWALGAIDIIDGAKKEINRGISFNYLINEIANQYNQMSKKIGYFSTFGKMRENGLRCNTTINKQYDIYKSKFVNLIENDPENTKLTNPRSASVVGDKKLHTMKYVWGSGNRFVILNKSLVTIREGADNSKEVKCQIFSPGTRAIPIVYKKIDSIFRRVQNNNDELTPENIDKITKDVAKVHWLISQTRPYYRGSAGIADIMAKSLFESKGIQVSPYKKDINPNLEAFVRSDSEYVNEYKNFFSESLKPIQDNKSV